MTEEKNIDASKQTDKSQEKFADERLSDKELDNVAGGTFSYKTPKWREEHETGK